MRRCLHPGAIEICAHLQEYRLGQKHRIGLAPISRWVVARIRTCPCRGN